MKNISRSTSIRIKRGKMIGLTRVEDGVEMLNLAVLFRNLFICFFYFWRGKGKGKQGPSVQYSENSGCWVFHTIYLNLAALPGDVMAVSASLFHSNHMESS